MWKTLKKWARRWLPKSVHERLSRLLYRLLTGHRRRVFASALAEFRSDPEAAIANEDLFQRLVYGWSNTRYSAGSEYLRGCVQEALACRGAILECGSGLTTILVGIVAELNGASLISLEHSEHWGAVTAAALRQHAVSSVSLVAAPLRDYGAFDWYSISAQPLPDHVDLVICDGPPWATRGGRYGLVPVVGSGLGEGTVILLDDAAREAEREAAERWARELPARYEICGTSKPFIRMIVEKRPER